MIHLKRHSVGLLVTVASGACSLHITTVRRDDRHDVLIAELQEAWQRQIDHRDDEAMHARVLAASKAQGALTELIRNGDEAAAKACATVLDEMRVRSERWWMELQQGEFISQSLLQTSLLRAFSADQSRFLAYAERAFDDAATNLRFRYDMAILLGAFRSREETDSERQRAGRLLIRAARAADSKLRRAGLMMLTGYSGFPSLNPPIDLEAAIPILREYAKDWVEAPGEKGWYVEALVGLEVDGYERYIREVEGYVQDTKNHASWRLRFAKDLLRWGRIDEATVVELEEAVAASRVQKSIRSTSTWKDGKLTRETKEIDP